MGNRSLSRVLLLVAVAAGTLAVCAVPYTALYRNARFSRLRLEELAGIQERYVNDPIFLTYFGRRLNERQQFTQALPVLERAAGLDPDSAPARDEWAKALLGTGQVSLAYGQLRQFLGTHPQSAEAYLLLGKYYVTQQDF